MKLFFVVAVLSVLLMIAPASFAKIVVIFDENAATEASAGKFAEGFVSHDAGSTVTISTAQKFTGKSSVFCTPSQSYNNNMTGWKFPINETPWMTFAWKKDGGTGIMIQMAYDGTWAYRYYSGANVTNWPGIQLEKEIPKDWKVYTRDLTKDFAKDWNLTGLALTPWDGNGGYYDYIILSTTEAEGKTVVQSLNKLTTTWGLMKR
ncbi:TPA: hypothetical protein ENX78_17100 [Candidatus Poribacteria bacterium]|nr:hypothetical protein [Candidatus Poribacteria bacterium]